MDVIDVGGEVSLITDQGLPESSLPNIGLAFGVKPDALNALSTQGAYKTGFE